jgi:hypothetical protein
MKPSCLVKKISAPTEPDANWDKAAWKNIQPVSLDYYMGKKQAFMPRVQVKIAHDNEHIYLIFKVDDCYVRCVSDTIGHLIWEDSCVEFFFAPDLSCPERYFNLEINCGGTPLFHYNKVARKDKVEVPDELIRQITIAHSLPKLIPDEIKEPISWTLEYKLPVTIMKHFSHVQTPLSGTKWHANFYKIADKTSNPHYLCWSEVRNPVPDFHLPEFFGVIEFE